MDKFYNDQNIKKIRCFPHPGTDVGLTCRTVKFPLPLLHALGSELTEVCSPYPGHWDGKQSHIKETQTGKYQHLKETIWDTPLLLNAEYSNRNGSLVSGKLITKVRMLNQFKTLLAYSRRLRNTNLLIPENLV